MEPNRVDLMIFECCIFLAAVENDNNNDTNNNSSNHNNNVSGSNSSHNTSEVIKTEGEWIAKAVHILNIAIFIV